jgi:hypothetical protein
MLLLASMGNVCCGQKKKRTSHNHNNKNMKTILPLMIREKVLTEMRNVDELDRPSKQIANEAGKVPLNKILTQD